MTQEIANRNSQRYLNVIAKFLSFFALAFFLSACLRYVPSRQEIASESDNAIAGPEAFDQHQQQLRLRLDELVASRSAVLRGNPEQQYSIGMRDVLRIDVFGFPDLSGALEVSDTGNIDLPLVGSISAAGKTIAQFNEDLRVGLKRYVRDPKVRVGVERYNAYRVAVVGAVPRPGWYPIKNSAYLLTEVLAEAGGIKEGGASRLYLIPRADYVRGRVNSEATSSSLSANVVAGANSQVAPNSPALDQTQYGVEIPFDRLVGSLDQPPLMLPVVDGDTIVVPEAGQFRVDGEVEAPGSFPITGKTTTLGAVAAAGGFTYSALVNEVEVIREVGQGRKASKTIDLEKVAFKGEPDLLLREGDVVVVPSAPGKFRARQVVEAFRTILRGGVSGSVRYQ